MSNYEQFFKKHLEDWKISSNEIRGKCPFHYDKNPSFSANIKNGTWKCFAGCGQGSFKKFRELIKEKEMELSRKYKKMIRKYHKHLLEKNILKDLPWSKRTVKKLKIGYHKKRLVFPHYNQKSNPINIKHHGSNNLPPYSISGHGSTRLYPLHLLKDYSKDERLIFAEGEKDVVTLLSNGYNAVTSTNGAGSIPDYINPVKEFKEIVIVFDNDRAGKEGSKKLANNLKSKYPYIEIKIAKWPDIKPESYDVTDLFKDKSENFSNILDNAERYSTEKGNLVNPNSDSKNDDFDITNMSLTDAGNAELFRYLYKGKRLYDHKNDVWLKWNGQYWQIDKKNIVKNDAIKIAKYIRKEANNIRDRDISDKLFKHSKRLESRPRINAMLDLAKSQPGIGEIHDNFNTDEYLLQFENGVYDLKKHIFRDGLRDDLITKSVGYDYDSNANCPRFKQFMKEVFPGLKELRNYLQKYIGYTLSGDTSDQSFLILHGAGSNGKSVFLEILRELLGDYSKSAQYKTFIDTNDNSVSNDLARLNGSRFVTCSEMSGQKKSFNSAKIKELTGNETVNARFLYKEFFEFEPSFKLYLAVNDLPKVKDYSYGFWRRVRIIPFKETFKDENRDKLLNAKLKKEISGIMNWAIEGWKKYKREGLNPPKIVKNAGLIYRSEEDLIMKFLNEKTIKDGDSKVQAGDLYACFVEWIKNKIDLSPITQTKFGRRMSQIPDITREKKSGQHYYHGIILKTQLEEEGVLK